MLPPEADCELELSTDTLVEPPFEFWQLMSVFELGLVLVIEISDGQGVGEVTGVLVGVGVDS